MAEVAMSDTFCCFCWRYCCRCCNRFRGPLWNAWTSLAISAACIALMPSRLPSRPQVCHWIPCWSVQASPGGLAHTSVWLLAQS
eukprot:scaffold86921_cov50-Prasinocladus_malaysianus.AAC.2